MVPGRCKLERLVSVISYFGNIFLTPHSQGYVAIFDATCKCITANYTLNDDGTVGVVNTCQELGIPISITGNASAVDAAYGSVGVFDVVLEGTGSVCPGPNYIVQGELPSI